MKLYTNGRGIMTRMAATPIYVKTIQKSSSPEPSADCNGSWYVALET